MCMFPPAGEGALFEFDASKQWRERGRGEMRLNVAPRCVRKECRVQAYWAAACVDAAACRRQQA